MKTTAFKPGHIVAPTKHVDGLYYVFCNGRLLSANTGTIDLDIVGSGTFDANSANWQPLTHDEMSALPFDIKLEHYLGDLDTRPCIALDIARPVEHPDYRFHSVRSLLLSLSSTQSTIVARAKQLIDWHYQSQFCGACGKPTRSHVTDRARYCEACELTFYPRIAPCVIVLVTRGDFVLLARSPHFPEEMYSTFAV